MLCITPALAAPMHALRVAAVTLPPDLLGMLTNLLFVVLPSLVGVAALITVITNILKQVGWVQDGTANQWSAGLNLAGILVLVLLKVFRPDLTYDVIDSTAAGIANILLVFSGYILQIIMSGKVQDAIRGIPVIGKSFSVDARKQFIASLPQK
jgi:hypothetical protein